MNKTQEALKLALEGLEKWHFDKDPRGAADYIAAIHDALAEQPAQQQEPYGQVTVVRRPGCVDQHWFYRWPEPPYLDNAAECHTVYTSPPASKPWVGLTQQAIDIAFDDTQEGGGFDDFARAIEAKLKEKNT